MKHTRWLALILLVLLLSGCSVRTRILPEAAMYTESADEAAPDRRMGSASHSSGANEGDPAAQTDGSDTQDAQAGEPDPNAPSRSDPTSERREYAPDADAVMSADAPQTVYQQTQAEELPPMPLKAEDADASAREAETAELTVTETRPKEEAEDLGVSADAKTADTMLQYYQALLDSRLSSLFECQRLYVYWETPADGVTIFKNSVEHRVILWAGGYDVSVKRPEDALQVDDGWISRKNPGCIVKCVDAGVPIGGEGQMWESLTARPGWNAIDAVRSSRVLLLREELLASPAGQTAAAVCIACVMYPELFEDTDALEAVEALLTEETGEDGAGRAIVYAPLLPGGKILTEKDDAYGS